MIACHDAGAANIIMAEESELGFPSSFYCLKGPALDKWKHKVPVQKLCSSLDFAISHSAEIRSGTGWQSDFEHQARIDARNAGIQVIAVIDHWVNYSERFEINGSSSLPDIIEVTDEHALEIARSHFPDIPIVKKKNFYLHQALRKVEATITNRESEILYVLEPIRTTWCRSKRDPEELQALNFFRTFILRYFQNAYSKIRLRPHPSENSEKYREWIQKNQSLPIIIDPYDDIETSIANASWVFGCNSYGLVIALECDKDVFCTLPPWAPNSTIPHSGLTYIRDIMTAE